jgi:hypothetical protein
MRFARSSYSPRAVELFFIFRFRGIKPDKEFTAAAGKSSGYVEAWKLADGDYLIAYGNNAENHHNIADDADDLASWLEDPDLTGLDAILQRANIRGVASINEVKEDSEGPFYVIKTCHYYGPIEKSRVVIDDYKDEPMRFEDYEDAMGWIRSEEDKGYRTAHNELSAPTYTIIAVPD